MSDRIDELKGNVEEAIGNLTGNRRLEVEGEIHAGTARAKRKTKAALREAGEAVKDGLDRLTEDVATQAKGTAEKLPRSRPGIVGGILLAFIGAVLLIAILRAVSKCSRD